MARPVSTSSSVSPTTLPQTLLTTPTLAQVEVDERQVNLSRFSLFFPEKREFFLEGRGNFDFTQPRNLDIPTMFFSRRIGLEQGQIVPINVGGRLTGKVGDFDIGAPEHQHRRRESRWHRNLPIFLCFASNETF